MANTSPISAEIDTHTISLYIDSVTVTRVRETVTVRVAWRTTGWAWNAWANIRGTSVHSKKNSQQGKTNQADSGTLTWSFTDADRTAHTGSFTYNVGVQEHTGGPTPGDSDSWTFPIPRSGPEVFVNIGGAVLEAEAAYVNADGAVPEADAVYLNVGGEIVEA